MTINRPRLAYLSKNEKDFYSLLDHMMDIAAKSLKIKRNFITKMLNNGLYPYTKRYLGSFDNHFSTIGLVGMNEACLNAPWLRRSLSDPVCQQFAKDVLNHMRERLSDYQELYGDLYNLEATPAESTAYRFAKHDKAKFPDIITAGTEDSPYYTNSSHLPVGFTDDIFEALDIQDELQTLYTSGTVFHAFLGEKVADWKQAAALVRKIAENYKLPYYTISPTYSICKNHGYLSGEVKVCPYCGAETEIYSRITGYYRPVKNWNDGKAQEFKERKEYRPEFREEVMRKSEPNVCGNTTKDTVVSNYEVPILVVTKTCPKCKEAEKLLADQGIFYMKMIAEKSNEEFVRGHGITIAPTLVIGDREYTGISGVMKYIYETNGWLEAK